MVDQATRILYETALSGAPVPWQAVETPKGGAVFGGASPLGWVFITPRVGQLASAIAAAVNAYAALVLDETPPGIFGPTQWRDVWAAYPLPWRAEAFGDLQVLFFDADGDHLGWCQPGDSATARLIQDAVAWAAAYPAHGAR